MNANRRLHRTERKNISSELVFWATVFAYSTDRQTRVKNWDEIMSSETDQSPAGINRSQRFCQRHTKNEILTIWQRNRWPMTTFPYSACEKNHYLGANSRQKYDSIIHCGGLDFL